MPIKAHIQIFLPTLLVMLAICFPAYRPFVTTWSGFTKEIANPKDLPDWTEISARFYVTGDFTRGIAAASRKLEINPVDANAYTNLGACLASLKRWDESIAASTAALRIDPRLTLPRNNLAWALQEKQAQAGSRVAK